MTVPDAYPPAPAEQQDSQAPTYAGAMTEPQRTILKHPNSAYLIVAFALLCVTAVVRSPLLALIYLIPIAGALYIARTATIVDGDGITVRAIFGSYTVTWPELAGLRLNDKSAVYAVAHDGTQTRLPCVRATKLAPLISASAGRIPDPAAEPAEPAAATSTKQPAEDRTEPSAAKQRAESRTTSSPADAPAEKFPHAAVPADNEPSEQAPSEQAPSENT